jgi:hypothetical protein
MEYELRIIEYGHRWPFKKLHVRDSFATSKDNERSIRAALKRQYGHYNSIFEILPAEENLIIVRRIE